MGVEIEYDSKELFAIYRVLKSYFNNETAPKLNKKYAELIQKTRLMAKTMKEIEAELDDE